MTLTKNRRATADASRFDLLVKSADVGDFERFSDEQGTSFRSTFGRLKMIFQKGDAERPVAYTQEHHSAVLAQLENVDVILTLLMRSLTRAHAKIEAQERQLAAAKALRTKAFDDLQVEQIDDRRIRLALGRGEDEASFELAFPMLIDRGAWSERASYDRGDAVTAGGGFWVAQVDNPPSKPGAPDSGWRLVVKSPRGSEQRK